MINDDYAYTEITERPVTTKPIRLNTDLGLNFEVSITLEYLITLSPIRE